LRERQAHDAANEQVCRPHGTFDDIRNDVRTSLIALDRNKVCRTMISTRFGPVRSSLVVMKSLGFKLPAAALEAQGR
jgi:hypothetical protein